MNKSLRSFGHAFRRTWLTQQIRQLFEPGSGGDKRRAQRARGLSLEPLEPRLLLSADLSYASGAPTDLTLRAITATQVQLFQTGGSAIGSAVLLDSSGILNLSRAGGLAVQSLAADTLRIDVASLSTLNVPGGLLDIRFVGGDQDIARDAIKLVGDSSGDALDFSLKVTANAAIEVVAGAQVNLGATQDLTLESISLQTGLVNSLAGGSGDGFNFFSFNHMGVDVAGQITANDVTLTAWAQTVLTNGSLPSLGGVHLAFAYVDSMAYVKVGGAGSSITTLGGGSLAMAATSDVNASALKKPDTAAPSGSDAAIAGLFLTGDAQTRVLNGAALSLGSGNLTMNATNIAVASAVADGAAEAEAKGAALAVATIGTAHDNLAQASIESGSTVTAGAITVSADSQNTLEAVANSTTGGATTPGSTTKSQQQLADNKAGANGQSVSLAGAVAVGIVKSDTQAFVQTGPTGGVTASGLVTVSSESVTHALTQADGSATVAGKVADNIGVAVAIGTDILDSDAYVTGTGSLSAGGLDVSAVMTDRTLGFTLAQVDDSAEPIKELRRLVEKAATMRRPRR